MQPKEGLNIVSHRPPVSVWSIVSREIILLPAELIPLPEDANRSRPNVNHICVVFHFSRTSYKSQLTTYITIGLQCKLKQKIDFAKDTSFVILKS